MSDWFNTSDLTITLALTAIVFGFLPARPLIIEELGRIELFRWVTVFILMWLFLGRFVAALIATAIVFIIIKLLDVAYMLGLTICPIGQSQSTSGDLGSAATAPAPAGSPGSPGATVQTALPPVTSYTGTPVPNTGYVAPTTAPTMGSPAPTAPAGLTGNFPGTPLAGYP
jgi:hypothetical protein